MKPLLIAFLVAIASLAYAPGAQAILTKMDLFIPNDGLVTRDTDTGLDWLDLTATTGSSVAEVLADINGYLARGFRRANLPEVCSLLSQAGGGACVLASSNIDRDPTDPVPTQELINLLGPVPGSITGFGTAAGYFEQGAATLSIGALGPHRTIQVQGLGSENRSSGHFLVRAVPEPSQAVLVLLTFVATFARGRARWRR